MLVFCLLAWFHRRALILLFDSNRKDDCPFWRLTLRLHHTYLWARVNTFLYRVSLSLLKWGREAQKSDKKTSQKRNIDACSDMYTRLTRISRQQPNESSARLERWSRPTANASNSCSDEETVIETRLASLRHEKWIERMSESDLIRTCWFLSMEGGKGKEAAYFLREGISLFSSRSGLRLDHRWSLLSSYASHRSLIDSKRMDWFRVRHARENAMKQPDDTSRVAAVCEYSWQSLSLSLVGSSFAHHWPHVRCSINSIASSRTASRFILFFLSVNINTSSTDETLLIDYTLSEAEWGDRAS